MSFSADIVWGCAVAADRINGGYVKETQWEFDEVNGEPLIKFESNKTLLKTWLQNNNFDLVTPADIEQGKVVRAFYKGFLLREMAGTITDFQRQALKIAMIDEFTGRMLLEFAITSCLPQSMRRDQMNTSLARAICDSTRLVGNIGDTVQGDIEVVKCMYAQDYNKHKVIAKMVDSFVEFWYNKHLEVGECLRIKGKIKAHSNDKTTRLNYVKRA